MTCGALILAAGASTRLGMPKQLVRLGNETLLERSVRIAAEAGCAPVVVVLGASEDLILGECNLGDALTVSNPEWVEGMGTSLSRGIDALEHMQGVSGILVMTCDMPAVSADHLRALAGSGTVTASFYAGRKGVPAYFPSELFSELRKIRGEEGARQLIRSACGVELPGGDLDIDTAEDLWRAQRAFG